MTSDVTFYDEWLVYWEAAQQRRAASRRVVHAEHLTPVATGQNASTAELISHRTGFATGGTATVISEIPVGHASGMHRHGEEAIYIISGTGCSAVEGRRYEKVAKPAFPYLYSSGKRTLAPAELRT